MGTAAAGGVLSAIGSIFGGMSGAAQSKYKAGIAELNARVARQNELWAREKGQTDAEQLGLKGGQEIAAGVAHDAASGLRTDSATFQQRIGTQRASTVFDQRMARFNADKAAWSDVVQARADTAEAQLDTSAAKYSEISGFIGAGSSILGAASSVSSKWLQGQQYGLWGGGDLTNDYGSGGTAS
jgi:hypothetical protein